jgi:hypothetical protein
MCSRFPIRDIALLFRVLQKIRGERLGAKGERLGAKGERLGAKGERLGIVFFQGLPYRDFAVENLSKNL